jgi:hypothetical protein
MMSIFDIVAFVYHVLQIGLLIGNQIKKNIDARAVIRGQILDTIYAE